MRISNCVSISASFSSRVLGILILVCATILVSGFSSTLLADPPRGIGTPEWTVPTTITSGDGYANLQWEMTDGPFAELFSVSEKRRGSRREYYVDRPELSVYRVEPGRYEFKVAACRKTIEGTPDCGSFSSKLRLTVTDEIYSTFPQSEPQLSVQAMSTAVAGGPDALRPGAWYNPAKAGHGWTFFWANRLNLPESDPLFGNAYDLIGVFYTYEAKSFWQPPGEPAIIEDYRPFVVTLKAVMSTSSVYSGTVYVTRNGVESAVGSADVTFGTDNISATIDWSVTFKYETLSDVDPLELLQGSNPTSIYNSTHYSGLFEHSSNGSYFVDDNIGSSAEVVSLVFYDNVGDPLWIQEARGGTATASSTDLCFRYMNTGYAPDRTRPGTFSNVWYDSGCDSSQPVSSANRNARRYFSSYRTEYFWASFTLPGVAPSPSGSISIGSSSYPIGLGKKANFHDISYDFVGGSSCDMTNITPSCTVHLTWFTDSDYPNATAYAYNQTTGTRTKILTSTEPAMENQAYLITDVGVYEFELRMGNSASSTRIADSNTFTVTSSVVTNPPGVPDAFHGIWNNKANSQYTLWWRHGDTQTVDRYEVEETKPDGAVSPLYNVSSGTSTFLYLDKSSTQQGQYQYKVRACNSMGCSAYTNVLNWFTTDPSSSSVFTDDFEISQGWTTNSSGTDSATTGMWERANPEQTSYSYYIFQRGDTVSGSYDLVTAGLHGSGYYSNDIDNGVTTITSPLFVVPSNGVTALRFHYYLAHSTSSSEDFFKVYADTPSGDVLLLEELGVSSYTSAVWAETALDLSAFAGQSIQIRFEAADNSPGDIVEAAVDDFAVLNFVANTPPTISQVTSMAFTQGVQHSEYIGISDPDAGDTLTCSLSQGSLPTGLSLTTDAGQNNCVISGTTSDNTGTYQIEVTVSDGTDSDSTPTINLVVNAPANNPPEFDLPIPDSPGLANTAVVDYRAAISDADGDTMDCSVAGSLPSGLSVSTVGNAECVISGTVNDTVEDYTFTLEVTDIPGGDTSSVPLTWEIQNTPPFFDAATATLQFIRGMQATRRLAVGDVDPGQVLGCSLSSGTLPSGLSFSSDINDGACVISGLTTVQPGPYNISFSVTDGVTSKNSGTIVLDVVDAASTFEYDARGRLVRMTDNSGLKAIYSLDKAGNRTVLQSGVREPTITSFMAPDIALYSDQTLGNFVTLMWTSENTSGCDLTLNTPPGTQSHPANHQTTLQLTQDTSFELSCDGVEGIATKTISLIPASGPTQ